MKGKIIKGVGGFYYVNVIHDKLYECKAKGIFRNRNIKPLVGDDVDIEIIDHENAVGNIVSILPRHSELIRPAAANVDQAVILFAAASPKPNLNLLDRFLILMEKRRLETVICFNKADLVPEDELEALCGVYRRAGYPIYSISLKTGRGTEELKGVFKDKTTVLAGPSGVGKSSLMNFMKPDAGCEIGAVSEKIKRGRHTTRHSELMYIEGNTYIMDTPGFSSLYITDIEEKELKDYFREFAEYEGKCRFQGCIHINEPDCAVKAAVGSGRISEERYLDYKRIYEEIKDRRKW